MSQLSELSLKGRRLCLFLAVMLLASLSLHAQNYSWDARSIGMGGETGLGGGNLAAGMVPSDRNYTSIVLPFGLIQVLTNLQVFKLHDPGFDALRAIDYIGDPFHYSFDRSQKTGTVDFLQNIVNAGFSRDLNAYRGFTPPQHLVAGGVLAPTWGYTFKVHRGANRSFQGIYLGAGPHISVQTDLQFDPRLVSILSSPVNVAVPANTTLTATNTAVQQTAIAVTGGYRAKIGFASSSSPRDGLYFVANFNYLFGLRQDTVNFNLQILTDAAGLVALSPLQNPLAINQLYSTHGRGYSSDFGMEVVKNGWEFGLGANDVANRIDWTNHHDKQYALGSLFTGAGFVASSPAAPTGTIRMVLPIEYASNLGYSRGRWTVRTDYDYGLQKFAAHAGAEYRVGPVALRGGARYGMKEWNPTGGIGFNLGKGFGIDLGVFGNSTNLEQQRTIAVAASLRFEHSVEK